MKKLLTILSFALIAAAAWAVPANPRPMPYVQPNGDTIMIRLVGDEHFHYNTTVDGYLIVKNAKGYFCYGKWSNQTQTNARNGKEYRVAVATKRIARDAAKRKKCEQRWLERQKKKSDKQNN